MALLNTLYAHEEFAEAQGDDSIAETTELENRMMETAEREAVVDDYEEDVETAMEAINELCELAKRNETRLKKGIHLDEIAAEEQAITRARCCKLIGDTDCLVSSGISTEAFGAPSSRKTLTELAIEEDKGTITKWWEAFVRFIKTAVAKVQDFIVSIFSTVQALQGRAQKLLSQVKDNKCEGRLTKSQQKKFGLRFRTKEDSVSNPMEVTKTILSNFSNLTGKMTSARNIIKKETENVANRLGSIDTGVEVKGEKEVVEKRVKNGELKTTVKTVATSDKFINEFIDGAKISGDVLSKVESNVGKSEGDTTVSWGLVAESYGGYLLLKKVSENKISDDDKATQADSARDLSASFVFANAMKFEEKDDKLCDGAEFVNPQAIQSTLKDIVSGCNSIRKFNDEVKVFVKTFDEAASKLSTKAKSIVGKAVSLLKSFGAAIKRFFTGGNALARWSNHQVSTLKAVCDVAAIILSNAPGDEEKKEEEKKDDSEKK